MKNYKINIKRNKSKRIIGMKVVFKKCSKCGEIKFRNKFKKDKKHYTGLFSICKECLKNRYMCTCEWCNKQFKSGDKGQRFCSRECQSKWHSESMRGENNPHYDRIKCICDYCGKEMEVSKSKYKRSNNHFCSNECHGGWKSENCRGENSPHYNKVECSCDYCGKEIKIIKSQYDKHNNHFCSNECKSKWHSESMRGENHPCYGKEGLKGENNPNYNPNLTPEEREQGRNIEGYKDWRKEVFERDNYTCQCCGKKGERLNAHHIFGYAEHKDLRTEVDNGITLCEDCHREYHKQYGYKNNDYKDFFIFLNNKVIELDVSKKEYCTNTIKDITLRLKTKDLI